MYSRMPSKNVINKFHGILDGVWKFSCFFSWKIKIVNWNFGSEWKPYVDVPNISIFPLKNTLNMK